MRPAFATEEKTMGLYVHNIGNLPVDDTRQYFLYVLDYGWQDPLTDALVANFRNMARMASETKSVVLAGIDPSTSQTKYSRGMASAEKMARRCCPP